MRKQALITASLFISVLFSFNSEAKIIDERIYLVSSGEADKRIAEKIKEALPSSMDITVKVEDADMINLPAAAYDSARKQYDAQILLKDFSKNFVLDINLESALVITDADIFSPGKDFVFSYADARKKTSVVSLARLKNEFYGLKGDSRALTERAVKESVHALGHSWGLADCKKPRCVMYLADGISGMDKKSSSFCPVCQNSVNKRYNSPLFKMPVF